MHVGGCLDLDDRRMCIAHELIALHIAIDGHTVPENEKPLATSNEYIRYVCTNGIHTTNSEEKRKARCVCRTGVLCCAVCVRTTANGQYLHWMVHWPRSPPSISLCHHWTMSAPIRWMLWCSLAAVCGSSGFLWRCACIWHTDESRHYSRRGTEQVIRVRLRTRNKHNVVGIEWGPIETKTMLLEFKRHQMKSTLESVSLRCEHRNAIFCCCCCWCSVVPNGKMLRGSLLHIQTIAELKVIRSSTAVVALNTKHAGDMFDCSWG